MSVEYSRTEVGDCAERLYALARAIVRGSTIAGVIFGGIGGGIVGVALQGHTSVGNEGGVVFGVIVGMVLGGLTGWELGRWRSLWLRLAAQSALCLAEIEAHTRTAQAWPSPDVDAFTAPTPRPAPVGAFSTSAGTSEPVEQPEPSAPLDPAATDLLDAAQNFEAKGSTGARSQALAYYQAFVDHYPTDPRVDGARESIHVLQQELRNAGEDV